MFLPIGPEKEVFYDTDRLLTFEIFDGATVGDPVLDAEGRVVSYTKVDDGTALMKDVSGQDLSFTLRKKVGTEDPAIIHKTTADDVAVVGVFNAARGTNTQRVEVQLHDTDTFDPESSPAVNVKPGTYQYALKQITDGDEQVLVYGPFTLLQAAGWE